MKKVEYAESIVAKISGTTIRPVLCLDEHASCKFKKGTAGDILGTASSEMKVECSTW